MENNFDSDKNIIDPGFALKLKSFFSKRNVLFFLVALGLASLSIIMYMFFSSQSKPAEEMEEAPETSPSWKEIELPSTEMKNMAGEVVEISGDKVKIKTNEKEFVLNISAKIPVYAFSEKGADAKSFSDIKVGSKISTQTDEKGETVSVYIIKQ